MKAEKPAAKGGRKRGKGDSSVRQTADIYPQLKLDISLSQIPPGARLVESQLAERYSVSRTPVRQALLALEQDGLVVRNGRSLQIRVPTTNEIIELYEVRELLEEQGARLAARRHDEADALVLKSLVARMSKDLNKRERYLVNREFHRAIWVATHHEVLLQTLERLYVKSVLGLSTTLNKPERWKQAVAEHESMLEAILDRDEDAAAEVVKKHLQTARDLRIEATLDRGDLT